jgi:hypothetical protein
LVKVCALGPVYGFKKCCPYRRLEPGLGICYLLRGYAQGGWANAIELLGPPKYRLGAFFAHFTQNWRYPIGRIRNVHGGSRHGAPRVN